MIFKSLSVVPDMKTRDALTCWFLGIWVLEDMIVLSHRFPGFTTEPQ